MDVITSSENLQVKAWKKLRTKKGRVKQQKYLLDGLHLVKEAILAKEPIEKIIVTSEFKHLDELEIPSRIEVIEVTKNIANQLSDTKSPQGIFAIVTITDKKQIKSNMVQGAWLFLDGIQNPGNIGTMVRTADAAGFSGVVFGKDSVDIYQPKLLRSMQGSQFHINILSGDLDEWITTFKEKNYPVFGTVLDKNARQYDQVGRHANFALIMGNEGNGLSEEIMKKTSLNLYIPLKGRAESLNVGVAAGILMFALI